MKIGQRLSGANFPVQVHDDHTAVQSQEAGAGSSHIPGVDYRSPSPPKNPTTLFRTLHQNITHAHSTASHMKNLLPRGRSRHSNANLDECFVLWTPTPNRSGL